jgi:hypothetical protein
VEMLAPISPLHCMSGLVLGANWKFQAQQLTNVVEPTFSFDIRQKTRRSWRCSSAATSDRRALARVSTASYCAT